MRLFCDSRNLSICNNIPIQNGMSYYTYAAESCCNISWDKVVRVFCNKFSRDHTSPKSSHYVKPGYGRIWQDSVEFKRDFLQELYTGCELTPIEEMSLITKFISMLLPSFNDNALVTFFWALFS